MQATTTGHKGVHFEKPLPLHLDELRSQSCARGRIASRRGAVAGMTPTVPPKIGEPDLAPRPTLGPERYLGPRPRNRANQSRTDELAFLGDNEVPIQSVAVRTQNPPMASPQFSPPKAKATAVDAIAPTRVLSEPFRRIAGLGDAMGLLSLDGGADSTRSGSAMAGGRADCR